MSGFNMPPGVSVSDIPGNSKADEDWDAFADHLLYVCAEQGMSIEDARLAWLIGCDALSRVRRTDAANRTTEPAED